MKNLFMAVMAAFGLAFVAMPAMAETPVHLDLSTSYTIQNSSVVPLRTNVGSAKATFSTDLNKVTLFADVVGSTASFTPSVSFQTVTADGGLTYHFSPGTYATVVGGTLLNTNAFFVGGSKTNTFVGFTVGTRVF